MKYEQFHLSAEPWIITKPKTVPFPIKTTFSALNRVSVNLISVLDNLISSCPCGFKFNLLERYLLQWGFLLQIVNSVSFAEPWNHVIYEQKREKCTWNVTWGVRINNRWDGLARVVSPLKMVVASAIFTVLTICVARPLEIGAQSAFVFQQIQCHSWSKRSLLWKIC